MAKKDLVLVSWVALDHDPYPRKREGQGYRLGEDGELVPGPTLSLLFDEQSEFRGRVGHVYLMHERHLGKAQKAFDETQREVRRFAAERGERIALTGVESTVKDPTDYAAILAYVRSTLAALRKKHPEAEFVLHVSPGTPAMQTVWVLMGATGMVPGPFRMVKSVERRHRREGRATAEVRIDFETYYRAYEATAPARVQDESQLIFWDPSRFRSTRLKELFGLAKTFARLRVPILILGERGTGKTTLANWIRVNSPYRRPENDGHWPAVPCGQYSREMMRAELFGYKKGAFTGALGDYEGLLTRADGDTLFLDEIGDMERDLQRLLIKAVEEKSFTPLGATRPVKSDFRLIAATNVPVHELGGRLDPDFLDRISIFTLTMPPLRELPEELDWLWEEVLKQAVVTAGAAFQCLSPFRGAPAKRLVTRLKQHPLPGNLRDLFRVAYRLVAELSAGGAAGANVAEAVEAALGTLTFAASGQARNSAAAAVAEAFAQDRDLELLVSPESPLVTREVIGALKRYMAGQLRRIASQGKVSVTKLADVTDRTLRDWGKG